MSMPLGIDACLPQQREQGAGVHILLNNRAEEKRTRVARMVREDAVVAEGDSRTLLTSKDSTDIRGCFALLEYLEALVRRR
jgi:hypothetical protein